MPSVSELTTKKHQLISTATEYVHRTSLKTAEDRAKHATMIADIDDITEQIDMLQQVERMLPKSPASPAATPAPGTPPAIPATNREQRTNEVWRKWLKSGYDERIPEHRTLLTSTDGEGGALLPQDMEKTFVAQAVAFYAPLLDYARVRWADTSNPVKWSRVDDRESGLNLISEGGGPVTEVDPTDFSSSLVALDKFSTGQIKYSKQLYEDSNWNLPDFLSQLCSIRFGRGLERILTRGLSTDGSVTPNNVGIVSLASTGVTTTALANGVAYSDLVNLLDQLDNIFFPKAVWMLNSRTRTYLLQQKDGTGRSFYVPAPTKSELDQLFGIPVVINQSLDNVTVANGVPIVLGSLSDGLGVSIRHLRVNVLRERYADTFEDALIADTAIGSTALAPGALQKLVLAAS